MAILCFKRRRNLGSGSSISTAKKAFPISCCFLSCFSPCRRGDSTIFHYDSAPVESMIEENERFQLETKIDEENQHFQFESKIDDLPDSLLMDILQRLPLNSVFKLKCVSKRWLTVISDPVFAQYYTSHRQSHAPPFALFYTGFIPKPEYPCNMVLYHSPSEKPDSMTFPLNFFESKLQKKQSETYPLELIGNDNDLLLFSGLHESRRNSYCVCNPLTFEWIRLPRPPRHRPRYPVVGFMVEDDGTFWVVQILFPEHHLSRFLIFQVFCSRTGKWCFREILCSRHLDSFCGQKTVVYKGIILWMMKNNLLAFDPKNDCSWCQIIDLPNYERGSFGVSSGHLHYYEVNSYIPWEPIENPILRVWVMINFEAREWVLQHSIRYGHLWSIDDCLKHCLLVPKKQKKCFEWVSFHPNDSDVVFLRCDGQLVICNVSSACLEVVRGDMKRNFCGLERDVLPLVFRSWPRAIAGTFKMNEASTS